MGIIVPVTVFWCGKALVASLAALEKEGTRLEEI
jgi:hypothetical protein